MKTKVGICTITIQEDNENAYNYGNRLQNYALQYFLNKNGCDSETIRYRFNSPGYMLASSVTNKENIAQLVSDTIRIVKRNIYKRTIQLKRNERKRKLDSFSKKHIKCSSTVYDANSDFRQLNENLDCFITGSDQVWNPYCEGSNAFYYLTFADKYKRIAYAPSIGVNSIPKEAEKNFKRWVMDIPYLSVREDVGVKLLYDNAGVEAKLVCDPVFLLSKEEWSEITHPIKNKKYFAVYILGKKSVELKKSIKKLERITGLKSFDIYTRDDVNSQFAGIEEFLGFIMNAEFLVTDSFHGTAFSLIFGTPMIITERSGGPKMNSRIDSILKVAGVGNRSLDYLMQNPKSIETINCAEVEEKMNPFIESSKRYLIDALEGVRKVGKLDAYNN